MKKRLLPLVAFLAITFAGFSQTDYSKVTFRSTIYQYKNKLPKTKELGIDRKLVSEIINTLGESHYSDVEKTDIINKAWLAFKNPKTFDFVYKDFAIKSNKSWSKVNNNGEMVLEPNPYLTEWTINDSEYPYFKIALNRILDHYNLISHGDDAQEVKSSFDRLMVTKNFELEAPKTDDWAYSYLGATNKKLAQKGLIALVTKGSYDIIVCKIENKDKITNLFKKIKWEFVTP